MSVPGIASVLSAGLHAGQVDQVLQDVQRCGGGLQSQMDITSPNAPPLTNPQAPRSSWEPQAAPNSPNLIVLAAAYMV